MLLHNPDFPQDAKITLLNTADECGIKFDTDRGRGNITNHFTGCVSSSLAKKEKK